MAAVAVAKMVGDVEDQFLSLIRDYERKHLHLIRSVGVHPQDAEDVLQNANLLAWRALSNYEGRSSLHTWMHRIVANASLDYLRKSSRRGKRIVPLDPDFDPPMPRASAVDENIKEMCHFIQKLPQKQRETLEMYLKGQSVDAPVLKSRKFRATLLLRRKMGVIV